MIAEFRENGNGALLRLIEHEHTFRQNYFEQEPGFNTHTIAWNRGASQMVKIDEVEYVVDTNTIIPLMLNQTFSFSNPEDVTAVQFNRDFYCIINHDEEVGCVGFLFFGPSPVMLINPEKTELLKIEQLFSHFREEISNDDSTKASMLRMLLVQYIIMLTRLSKRQYLKQDPEEEQFNLLRRFNLLVEMHFRKEKQVKFYAAQLHKSPKTLSNVFSGYCKKSPLTIIHERVVAEAKRLIYYTDKSVKEIAAELGFEDVSHFSKFIKGYTSQTPTQLKKTKEQSVPTSVSL